MSARRDRRDREREHAATEMIPGGRRGRRSVVSNRQPAETRMLEAAPELSPAEKIEAALERRAPSAPLTPRPQPEQEPARKDLARIAQQAQITAREPRFTPSRGMPAAPQPPERCVVHAVLADEPGPVRITGELPLFAEALQARAQEAEAGRARDALPSLLWCAECGRDFADEETAKYDRMLQFLHFRAAEAGWRRDARGLMHCPQCQQSRWMATWFPPVLAGGGREAALRRSVEGPLPAGRRDFMPPSDITFSSQLEEAATVIRDADGTEHVQVDWKSVIARPQRPGGVPGGRHRKQSDQPAVPTLKNINLGRLATRMDGRRAS